MRRKNLFTVATFTAIFTFIAGVMFYFSLNRSKQFSEKPIQQEPDVSVQNLESFKVDKSEAENPAYYTVKFKDRVKNAPAVFSSRNMLEGEVFTTSNLRIVQIDVDKIPPDSFGAIEPLLERRVKTAIPKGSMITLFHVKEEDYFKWTSNDESFENMLSNMQPKAGYQVVLYPLRYIPEGTRIDAFSVSFAEIKLSKVPEDAVKSYKSIFGKKTNMTICQGQIIRKSYLVEENRAFNSSN